MKTSRPDDWVKKLGQWHIVDPQKGVTRCGLPMLGNNYARLINDEERTKCSKCWEVK